MIRFLLVLGVIVIILLILSRRSKKDNLIKSNTYKKIIFLVVIFGVIFLLATSGRFILPQILQLLKIGLPFLTKFIGL